MAIQSFGNKETEQFFESGRIGRGVGWMNVRAVAQRKLDMVHYAVRLSDLKSPPGNRLEALTVDLVGFHSVRINDQWRVVFRWTEAGPVDVRICDYQ